VQKASDAKLLLTASDTTVEAQARHRLEAVIRSKDELIAAIGHELRTPLTSVLGFAEIVEDAMDQGDTLRPLVSEVVRQSTEMAAIIDNLLVAARADAVATAPNRFDLTAEAVSVADALTRNLGSTPRCASTGAVPAFANPARTQQIIRNLLVNADKHGGDSILLVTRKEDDSALLEVRDNGSAIPDEHRERIFDPYESSGPTPGQPAALGIGLAASRRLAEMMNGEIRYHHDGKWSVFALRLPSTEPPAAVENSAVT
jgi:signal transduction histidine kinase